MTLTGHEGIKNFGGRLRRNRQKAEEMANSEVKSFAELVQAKMREEAPMRSGFLRQQIQIIDKGQGMVEVGPVGVHYWRYVEEGTRPHTIRPKNAQALRFTINGRVVYAKSVNHPGTKAQPYIKPTLEWAREELPKRIQAAASDQMKGN